MPQAARLAVAIAERCNEKSELVQGRGGVFDVRLDGETLFSKHDVDRFPQPGEVENILAERLA
ncbi:MAG: Rdx family protein [Thermoanaerobaculia bacterium]